MGNPVVHFEIFGADGAQLRAFYAKTFGWKLSIPPDGDYAMVDTDSGGSSIRGGIAEEADAAQGVVIYVLVSDINYHLEQITSAGGSVVQPRTEFGPVTTALATDPAGNIIGLTEEPAPPSPH